MRKIKFRGKRKDTGEWVYGGIREIWSSNEERYVISPGKSFESDSWTDINEAEIILKTVGQYTGLKDKNGVKIFEGDIVKSVNNYGDTVQLGVVEFCSDPKALRCGGFGIRLPDGKWGGFYPDSIYWRWDDPSNWDEVIGNIHDNNNPELLEGAQ